MSVEELKEENTRLRRRLRDTRDALRDAEDTIDWLGRVFKAGTMDLPVEVRP